MSLSPLYVFIGCGFGGCSRFLIMRYLPVRSHRHHQYSIPIIVCNVLGCLLIGIFLQTFPLSSTDLGGTLSSLLISGYLGGFTTFSSFAIQTCHIIQYQWQYCNTTKDDIIVNNSFFHVLSTVCYRFSRLLIPIVYIMLYNGICFAAVWFGLALASGFRSATIPIQPTH